VTAGRISRRASRILSRRALQIRWQWRYDSARRVRFGVPWREVGRQRGPTMARLSLTLLGDFQARLGPGPPLRLKSRKTEALLAWSTDARG
jgi:hypothetical protein